MLRRQVLEGLACAATATALTAFARRAPCQLDPARQRVGSSVFADLELTPPRLSSGRARVLMPRREGAAQRRPAPALLLLHGKGEARDERVALRAWQELYGAEHALRQLRGGQLEEDRDRQRYLPSSMRADIHQRLADDSFGNLILICPVTPDPDRLGHRAGPVLDGFARWLVEELLPEVRQLVPLSGQIGLDGCSMGGRVALEVLRRQPSAFSSFGVVQPAMGEFRVPGYAAALAEAGAGPSPPRLRLLTSSLDPYRKATLKLSQTLRRGGTPHTLSELPGPHTQPWLRAAGTPTTLLWHERVLRGLVPAE